MKLRKVKTYLGFDKDKVLYFFDVVVIGYLDVFAIEIAKCPSHSKTSQHSSENYISSLFLYSILFV